VRLPAAPALAAACLVLVACGTPATTATRPTPAPLPTMEVAPATPCPLGTVSLNGGDCIPADSTGSIPTAPPDASSTITGTTGPAPVKASTAPPGPGAPTWSAADCAWAERTLEQDAYNDRHNQPPTYTLAQDQQLDAQATIWEEIDGMIQLTTCEPYTNGRTAGSGDVTIPDAYLGSVPGSAPPGTFPRLKMTQAGCDFALSNLEYGRGTHVQELQALEAGTATPVWGQAESLSWAEQWDEQWITNYDRLIGLFNGTCSRSG